MINLSSGLSKDDIKNLIEWLSTEPRLTQGEKVKEFEEKFAEYLGCKYAVFCNSGSSANLLSANIVKQRYNLVSGKVIVPRIGWSTTISPFLQLGFNPIMCDPSTRGFGVDIDHFEQLCKKHRPTAAIIVHVLGFSSHILQIRDICNDYNVVLIEDTCESLGSEVLNKKLGSFGDMSTFSFYFGHHMSTIEGGMLCTNDSQIDMLARMIRSHGWSRDISEETQTALKNAWQIDDFNEDFTFYMPGYNLRGTDLQAVLGLKQLEKLPDNVIDRHCNFFYYQNNINGPRIEYDECQRIISNMGYPIVSFNRKKIVEALTQECIECRPLISGDMARQPFWIKKYGPPTRSNPYVDMIHKYGMYIPNHQNLLQRDLRLICDTINGVI